MLSPNFYVLIGALESARAFIERYYRDLAPYTPTGAKDSRPLWGEGKDSADNDASGDSHLDPDPGTVSEAAKRLPKIKDALLDAEGQLSIALYSAGMMLLQAEAEKTRKEAWEKFSAEVTKQSFIIARVVRRLLWISKPLPGNPNAGTGAPEWEMMDKRLHRILKAFAEVGLGGGEDDPALKGPGILGSSDESISF